MSELLAVFCCGAFFGPMYRRAAPMQVALATVGTLAGVWSWWQRGEAAWLVGALLLFSVVPFTLLRMMHVNELLLAPAPERDDAETEALLRRWGSLHAIRTLLSGLCFVAFLWALAFGYSRPR